MEEERRLRIYRKLAALGASEVCVEDEAGLIEALQKHHAQVGKAVRVDGRQRHRVRVVRLALFRFRKPFRKKPKRVRGALQVTTC